MGGPIFTAGGSAAWKLDAGDVNLVFAGLSPRAANPAGDAAGRFFGVAGMQLLKVSLNRRYGHGHGTRDFPDGCNKHAVGAL